MPWKIVRGHVVNQETGQPVNKNPLAKARLQKLMAALYANVNHKESPTQALWMSFKAATGANWGAKVGQNIIGRLFRGGGGQFSAEAGAPSRSTPVSKSVQYSGVYRRELSEGIRAIDSVHTDGVLPGVRVNGAAISFLPGMQAVYGYAELSPRNSSRIYVFGHSQFKELSVVHEMGHYLDHQGFGRGQGFASQDSPVFAGFRKAVKQSNSYKTIEAAGRNGFVRVGTQKIRVNKKLTDYYLSDKELWARAYSQYIAVKSGNKSLLRGIRQYNQVNDFNVQWTSKDFLPIEREIDKIMRSRGWLN